MFASPLAHAAQPAQAAVPPSCRFVKSCPFFQNQPPSYTITCTQKADYFTWSGTPISPTTPPLGKEFPIQADQTSFSGSTTDYQIFAAACDHGLRNECVSYSIYAPVANYCHKPLGVVSGGGGNAAICRTCEQTGRTCKITNGRAQCVGLAR